MTPPVRAIATTASGPDSPNLRVRGVIPADELRRHGVELDLMPLLSRTEHSAFNSGRTARRLSVVLSARRRLRGCFDNDDAGVAVVYRHADLFPSLALERAAADGRRLIYDVDDAIWFGGRRAARGHLLSVLKASRRKAKWLAGHASHVVAGNEYLADWLSDFAKRVTVVPSLVETNAVPVRAHRASDELILGWIGSPTTSPYLRPLGRPLARLAEEVSEFRVRLLTVGGTAPEIPGIATESRPWSAEAERQALAEMDIGLMPSPDNEWTRGKCAYKAIQYMASGIPVVADDVGITARVVGDGEAGAIVRGDLQWADAILELGRDSLLRQRLGSTGRERAERDYSVSRWAPTLASILRGDGG